MDTEKTGPGHVERDYFRGPYTYSLMTSYLLCLGMSCLPLVVSCYYANKFMCVRLHGLGCSYFDYLCVGAIAYC